MPTQLMTALRPGFPSLTRRQRVIGLLLFFAYIGATILGIQSFVAPAILTPTSGIALAGLVIGGIELWPMVFLAAVAAYMFYGSTWVTILFMSVGVTLQAVIGAYALKKLSFNPSFERLRDMLSFMVVAFVSSTIVPSLGFLSRALNHLILNRPSITSSVTWGSWWTG
ncbi:MAG TPA: hypothetical protein VHF05_00710, partial [Candidatus Paceibacterota bacterium]|nr:hypothetical protein [Candidatus Paceibacterota bacterium]